MTCLAGMLVTRLPALRLLDRIGWCRRLCAKVGCRQAHSARKLLRTTAVQAVPRRALEFRIAYRSIRQREHPQHRSAVGILDVRCQRVERAQLRRAVADRHRDILLAADAVADGEGIRRRCWCGSARAPCRSCRHRRGTSDRASRRKRCRRRSAGRRWSSARVAASTMPGVWSGELDRVEPAEFAVAVGDRRARVNRTAAAGVTLAGIERRRRRVRSRTR